MVVKSEGMIRPNNQLATVINTYGGTLETIYVEDGSLVKEGDTLFIVDHGDLLTEQKYYEEQLNDTEENIKWLSTYKQSVEDSVNYFTNTSLTFHLNRNLFSNTKCTNSHSRRTPNEANPNQHQRNVRQ